MRRAEDALTGRRVVVTRRSGQASSLVSLLEGRGAEVIEVPAIEVRPPSDPGPLDEALRGLDRYAWLVFTSANAVSAVRNRMENLGLQANLPAGPRIASVGPATTQAVHESFPAAEVALQPERATSATGLVQAFRARSEPTGRVLVPASSLAGDEVPAGLRSLGACVDLVVAYETVEPTGLREQVARALAGGFDLVAFASPSAVHAFSAAAGPTPGLPAAVIGPTTERAARAAGFSVVAVAFPSTAEGLALAVVRALRGGPGRRRSRPFS